MCCTSLQKALPRAGVFGEGLSCAALVLHSSLQGLTAGWMSGYSVQVEDKAGRQPGSELGKTVEKPSLHHDTDFF